MDLPDLGVDLEARESQLSVSTIKYLVARPRSGDSLKRFIMIRFLIRNMKESYRDLEIASMALERPLAMNLVTAVLQAAVVLHLVAAACIVLFECDAPVLVYLPLDLEVAVLIGALPLDLVTLDIELLEYHRALAAIMLSIEPTPDGALLSLGLSLGD